MNKLILILGFISFSAAAQDFLSEPEATAVDRDPAAVQPLNLKRSYPGAQDEEDLRVQAQLPEAAMRADTRGMQREIFKALYNQELKDEHHDEVEE
jgi:hypothetical protein